MGAVASSSEVGGQCIRSESTIPLVQVVQIGYAYQGTRVLRGASLTVRQGERVVLLGKNGSGKTTLLRIIAGLLQPVRGQVILAGQDVRYANIGIRQIIGMAGHQSYLYDDMTGLENLLLFAALYGVPSPVQRAHELLARVRLDSRRHERVRTYSRGMTQRLSLARALVHDPPLLLLDEPDSGLDVDSLGLLPSILTEPRADGSARAVIFTTHRPDWGRSFAHAVCMLDQGRLVGGTAREGDFHAEPRSV